MTILSNFSYYTNDFQYCEILNRHLKNGICEKIKNDLGSVGHVVDSDFEHVY